MIKDDDQNTTDGSIVDSNVQESIGDVSKESERVVKQRRTSSIASQPGELQHEDETEETREEEQEISAEDSHTLEDEVDNITVSAPILYVVLVYIMFNWKLISVVLLRNIGLHVGLYFACEWTQT